MELLTMHARSVDGKPQGSVHYYSWNAIERVDVDEHDMVVVVHLLSGSSHEYRFDSGKAFGATWDLIRGIDHEEA